MEMKRHEMIIGQLRARGISDTRVLTAMASVPREEFLPPEQKSYAYEDRPLPIGFDQTISQPYMVAWMLELLELKASDRLLEVGTGSGYSAAVASRMVKEVYSVERVPELLKNARNKLQKIGYENVELKEAEKTPGWQEKAPFDAIVVTAAAEEVPDSLKQQLASGGRMVIPVGAIGEIQRLSRIRRKEGSHFSEEEIGYVRFVPLL